MNDTIAAISSPFGEGAVAVLRISGPAARNVLAAVFATPGGVEKMTPRELRRGRIVQNGIRIDDVLAVFFPGPRSFTGEDVVEIHGHGGVLVTRKIFEALLQNGARGAEPGEFSQRAFENGKIDLTQAEAVMDVIRAQTDLALRAAQEQLSGRLGLQMAALRQNLLEIRAQVEAHIDFPDEDIEPETHRLLLERLRKILAAISALLGTARQGRLLRAGVLTVLTGAPNVGKSSLLNALSGFSRAIVSPIPGTTRDTVEERINLDGIPLVLIDTAGLRQSDDAVEQLGVERSLQALEKADLILQICAAPEIPPENLTVDPRAILVLNKSDLGRQPGWPAAAVAVSCLQNTGFEDLRAAITRQVFGGELKLENVSVAINLRHQRCLERAQTASRAALSGLEQNLALELIACELQSAMEAIGDVLGRVENDEVLGEIFSTFCIGK